MDTTDEQVQEMSPMDVPLCTGTPYTESTVARIVGFPLALVAVIFLCGFLPAVFIIILAELLISYLIILPLTLLIYSLAQLPESIVLISENFKNGYRGSIHGHKPIHRGEKATRLVEIQPGTREDPIVCKLLVANLTSHDYEALSYTWGPNVQSLRGQCRITLDDRPFWIQKPLERALRELRQEHESRLLWIDALCIEQDDYTPEAQQEKAQQVSLMASIYANAVKTIVFLDLVSPDSEVWHGIEVLFAKLTAEHSRPGATVATVLQLLSNADRRILQQLLDLPWWNRIWVIQEVLVSRRVEVQCGPHQVNWEILSVLLCCGPQYGLSILESVHQFATLIQVHRRLQQQHAFGCFGLMFNFRRSQTSLARDRIYAMVGFVDPERHGIDLQIDYLSDDPVVFEDFTRGTVNRYGNPNILVVLEQDIPKMWDELQRLVRTSYRNKPSWVYTWPQSRASAARNTLWEGGLSMDSIETGDKFSAAGNSTADCHTSVLDPSILCISGAEVDSILSVGMTYHADMSQARKRRVLEAWYTSLCIADSLLVEDAKATFLPAITAGVMTGTLPETAEERWRELSNETTLRAIDYAASGRRLIKTNGHRVGLGHANCRSGDLVCLFMGAAVPYILRVSNHTGPGILHSSPLMCLLWCRRETHRSCCMPTFHTLVGQAYIDGMMIYDGDINHDIESGRITPQQYFLE